MALSGTFFIFQNKHQSPTDKTLLYGKNEKHLTRQNTDAYSTQLSGLTVT